MEKRRAMAWTVGALVAAVMIGFFAVYSYSLNNRQGPRAAQNTVSDVRVEEGPPMEYQYVLRAAQGKLAVYLKGEEEEPRMTFNVSLRMLPEYDQRALEEGIYVADYQALVERIEDFVS